MRQRSKETEEEGGWFWLTCSLRHGDTDHREHLKTDISQSKSRSRRSFGSHKFCWWSKSCSQHAHVRFSSMKLGIEFKFWVWIFHVSMGFLSTEIQNMQVRWIRRSKLQLFLSVTPHTVCISPPIVWQPVQDHLPLAQCMLGSAPAPENDKGSIKDEWNPTPWEHFYGLPSGIWREWSSTVCSTSFRQFPTAPPNKWLNKTKV